MRSNEQEAHEPEVPGNALARELVIMHGAKILHPTEETVNRSVGIRSFRFVMCFFYRMFVQGQNRK